MTGPVDGKLANNRASLILPGGYLPHADARQQRHTRPAMAADGAARRSTRKRGRGRRRAGEREHRPHRDPHAVRARAQPDRRRACPPSLPEEEKFQIARRVVGAEQQYITYHEFLPALGVHLPQYRGYNPDVDPTLSNEFATVGYRAHSMIHGEFELERAGGTYSPTSSTRSSTQGIEVEDDDDETRARRSRSASRSGTPTSSQQSASARFCRASAASGSTRTTSRSTTRCGASCSRSRSRGAAIRRLRRADHQARVLHRRRRTSARSTSSAVATMACRTTTSCASRTACAPKTSFTEITGESTELSAQHADQPARPDRRPDILDFTKLRTPTATRFRSAARTPARSAVTGVRRSTARGAAEGDLRRGNVNKIDAFVGMLSEQHVRGTEFGELQLAIWTQAVRGAPRRRPVLLPQRSLLATIREQYGIDYRQTLAESSSSTPASRPERLQGAARRRGRSRPQPAVYPGGTDEGGQDALSIRCAHRSRRCDRLVAAVGGDAVHRRGRLEPWRTSSSLASSWRSSALRSSWQ